MRTEHKAAPRVRFGGVAVVGLLPFLVACTQTPEVEEVDTSAGCYEQEEGTIVQDVYVDKFGPAPLPICPPKPVVVPVEEEPERNPGKDTSPIPFTRPGSDGDFAEQNQPSYDAVSERNGFEGSDYSRPGN